MSTEDIINLACPNCARVLRAPASAIGKTGKCNNCGTKIAIERKNAPVPSGPKTTHKQSAHPAAQNAARTTAPTSAPTASPRGPRAIANQAGSRSGSQSASPSPSHPGLNVDEFLAPDLDFQGADFQAALQASIAEGQHQVVRKVAGGLSREQVAAAITQSVPKRFVSPAYRLHLMLVALVMAVLPLLYIAFIAVVGVGVGYYITNIIPAATAKMPIGRFTLFYLLIVVTPAIVGVILVLFMIKPLFFRIRDERRRRSLNRSSQPLLFELVDRICEATGAPVPKRIDVDYQVNASAQPLGGLLSVARGQMVLTIGVPLIGGLTARQLAGVLAHEFGHFSQKVGMGASLLIRKVNLWFTRLVYQRDTLDVMLDNSISESDWRVAIVLQLASLCIAVSRGILWCFMMLGYFISAGLMRQMEYDADRYEYGLVGSRTFKETSLELQMLGVSQASALNDMLKFCQAGRLADDMIVLLTETRKALPADVYRKVMNDWQNQRSGWFDTHPSDQARIARAADAEAPGCFQLERPARDLVKHYDEICKGVTWDFYKDQLGGHITPQQLTPTEQLIKPHV